MTPEPPGEELPRGSTASRIGYTIWKMPTTRQNGNGRLSIGFVGLTPKLAEQYRGAFTNRGEARADALCEQKFQSAVA